MKQEKLSIVLRELIHVLSTHCENVNQRFEMAELADFKNNTKKFRDFLQMLQIHLNDDHLEMPRSLKQLYYIAGKSVILLSELDMLQQTSEENMETIQRLQNEIQGWKAEWSKHFSSKTLPKLQSKLQNIKFESVPNVALSNFFNVRASAMVDGFGEELAEEETDVIRRNIREVISAADIAKKQRSQTS